MIRHAMILTGLLLLSCAEPTAGKPTAEVSDAPAVKAPSEAVAPPAAPPPADAGVTMTASAANSKLEWVASKVTRSHPGGFNDFTVEATAADGQLTSVNATIQMASVFADVAKLTNHLKSADFFDIEKYSTATFTSTSITPSEGEGTHFIVGNLDLHGVTNEITFPVSIEMSPSGGANVTAEFAIDRQDWAVSYPGKPDDLIKDLVLIKMDINLTI